MDTRERVACPSPSPFTPYRTRTWRPDPSRALEAHGRLRRVAGCESRSATARRSPSDAHLAGGEAARVESGAMAAHSAGVHLDAKMEGGLMKSLRRSVLGGESLFMSTYTAPMRAAGSRRPRLPGDVFTAEVDGTYILTRGAFLACSAELQLDTKRRGFGNLFGRRGRLPRPHDRHGHPRGLCYGALDRQVLRARRDYYGRLLAPRPDDEGIQISARKAAKGLVRTAKTSEDLVFDVTGPGEVTTQSRAPTSSSSGSSRCSLSRS